jgi:hypothetical protein
MKPVLLAMVLMAAAPTPAAACHRFARWRYPWPQRCGAIHAERPARVAAREIAPAPFAPIRSLPPPTLNDLEDQARREAIDRLKIELAIRSMTVHCAVNPKPTDCR